MNLKYPMVSIIIPVYKDWKGLELCLAALKNQDYPQNCFEIIIINNDPVNKEPEHLNLPVNAKLIHEGKPGSYAARNAGLEIIKGDIIGFTDSDCIPYKEWIKNAVIYFHNNKDCSRIAGKVALFCRSPKPTTAEIYEMLYAFDQIRYVKFGTSVTANMFTYKHVFHQIGYFNENLLSGGDYLWGTLAEKAGFKITYVDNVVVDHPARHSLLELISKEKRVGAGQAFFLNSGGNNLTKFLRFMKVLKPKIFEFKFIKQQGNFMTLNDQIKIFLIRHLLLAIRGYAKFRVETGKIPTRK